MVKTLRYTLMAVVAMVANFSFAQTKIDFTQQAATLKDKVGYTLTAEGYTFEADKAAGTTVPTQNTNSKDLRHYAKNTLTISGPAMKEIVFTMSAAGKKQWGDVTLGGGPIICRNADINPVLYSKILAAAKKSKIPVQIEAGHRASGGTDTAQIQLSRAGVATALVSIPNRYMHTPIEMCDLRDAEKAAKLIADTIMSLDETSTFIPGID